MAEREVKARILGTGSYLPERILSNTDLEKIVDTSDEWIFTRTGMKERRIARDDEYTSTMGLRAAHKALEKAGITAKDLDLIIVATTSPDYIFPSTAAVIQQALGITDIPAFDIQAACTGFLYALSNARAYVESGIYKHVLVVASEKLSSITNYGDRTTCVLFGDGAGAAIIGATGPGLKICEVCIGAEGGPPEVLGIVAGGCRHPATEETIREGKHFVTMQGQEIFKKAVRFMESIVHKTLQKAGVAQDKLSWMIPHQANIRIIEALRKRFDFPEDRVFCTIQKYGNTSASSVPIALDELLSTKEIKVGEHLLCVAFGGGITYGAAVLEKVEA